MERSCSRALQSLLNVFRPGQEISVFLFHAKKSILTYRDLRRAAQVPDRLAAGGFTLPQSLATIIAQPTSQFGEFNAHLRVRMQQIRSSFRATRALGHA